MRPFEETPAFSEASEQLINVFTIPLHCPRTIPIGRVELLLDYGQIKTSLLNRGTKIYIFF